MPDISMCGNETCPVRTKCYRNPASGTTPAERGQSWMMFSYDQTKGCDGFWPATPATYEPGEPSHFVPVTGERDDQ